LEQVYTGALPERPFGLTGVWGTATSNPFTHPEDSLCRTRARCCGCSRAAA
jgi:hypothetical protein